MVEQKTKKFVFNVYQDNISLVESLSYEQKNELINVLLDEHRLQVTKQEKGKNLINFLKKISIVLILIMAGMPIFMTSVNLFFDLTVNSYSKMEQNFERLFNEQKR